MQKKWKRTLCAAAAALCIGAVGVGVGAAHGQATAQAGQIEDVVGTKRYIISNPYSAVNWDTWGQYKAATHVHSKMSDGHIEFSAQVENYYRYGFDALAMTDHMTVNYGWTAKKTGTSNRPLVFAYNGTNSPLSTTRYQQMQTGSDRGGRPMIEIPMGIELNGMSTKKCHINGYYADAGHGDAELSSSGVSGCVTAISKNHAAGGITHINHIGEFMEANDCDTAAEAFANVYTNSFISDMVSKVFRTYPSCVGMELVNKSDGRTKWDRYLYDEFLMRLAPVGRTLWGFCEDDSHYEDEIDQNCQWFILPQNNAANIRTAMETGTFFCSSRKSRTELSDMNLPDDKGNGDYPRVWRIDVDDTTSRITVNCTKARKIVLIADRQEIDVRTIDPSGEVVTFDLNAYESSINSYVRIYLAGDGGITYIQPFYLTTSEYAEECTVDFSVLFNGSFIEAPTIIVRNALGTIVPMTTMRSIKITQPGTYTYEVSTQGSTTKTGSFTITEADFVNGNNYQFSVSLESAPQLAFYESMLDRVDESENIITGFTVGDVDTENIAYSTSSLGTVEIVPTENGYGTGTKLNLVYDGQVIDSYTFVIYGDTDGDSYVDATDSVMLDAYLDSALHYEIDEAALKASDADGDGYYTVKDAELMRDIGMGLEYTINQNR